MIPAGRLRHRARLQVDKGTTVDRRNQPIADWQTIAIIPVSIESLGGTDLEVARTIYTEATHKITARYNQGITKETRLLFNGKQFEIGYIENVGEVNKLLVLLCTAAQ